MSIRDEIAKLVGSETARHKRLVEYVLRQVRIGRNLSDVLDDPYVTNRLGTFDRLALLEEPEIVEAVSDEILNDLRARLERVAAG
jgi:hypothetical protein